VQFGSLFSEQLITSILYDLNIKASRCNFAKMHLNGKYHGVYVNVERIDSVFIKNNFADGGALYKSDKGGAGGNLELVIQLSDPNARRGLTLEPKSPSVHTDARDVLELISRINQTSDDDFAKVMATGTSP
jgi:spore coat protein CotH